MLDIFLVIVKAGRFQQNQVDLLEQKMKLKEVVTTCIQHTAHGEKYLLTPSMMHTSSPNNVMLVCTCGSRTSSEIVNACKMSSAKTANAYNLYCHPHVVLWQ